VTFDQATEAYLQKFEDSWKNRAHRRQWRSTMREQVSPALGKLDVAVINAEGGINGRKIRFISYDDAYSQPKAVEQARRLVESGGAFLIRSGKRSGRRVVDFLNRCDGELSPFSLSQSRGAVQFRYQCVRAGGRSGRI
jgi:hypothetical protein